MARPDPSGRIPDVSELLEQRSGEAMALNQRHLNPQLGRILRTLGFDREWVEGRGSLPDRPAGRTRTSTCCRATAFSPLGRSHPYVKDQLTKVIAADTANLPQLGVSTLPGVLAEQLIARAPAPLDGVVLTSSRHRGGRGRDQAGAAPPPGGRGSSSADHGFHGLTLGSLSLNGNEEFRERFGPLLPGLRPGSVRGPRRAPAGAR